MEGISYLLLLFVAKPLEVLADVSMAVRIAGSIHGLLFIWLICAIILVLYFKKISFGKAILVFIASLIPFATFFLERIVLGRKSQ